MKSIFLAALAASVVSACAIDTPILSKQRTDDNFSRIHTGMTEAEIEQVAGTPDEKMRFPLSGNYAWSYRYYDTWGYYAEFSVTFAPDGRSVSKISRRYDGGDKGK